MSLETRLDQTLREASARSRFDTLVVAVSGGSDSLALLHLVCEWAGPAGVTVAAITVDHGLRKESAAEARHVAAVCAGLGVAHETLRWDGWNRQGNLQQAAREARYDLLARHAPGDAGRGVILLGHTEDDLAETFLMRLARGSGIDGLSAMRMEWHARGRRWMRPLLGSRRADLREYLRKRGVDWIEDPTNLDPRYDRVKARQALEALAPLGLGVDRLAATAHAMRRARLALERAAFEAAQTLARVEAGEVVFDRAGLRAAAREVSDRLLAHALRWVGGQPYRPRYRALEDFQKAIESRQPRLTLAGCLVSITAAQVRIGREPAAVQRCEGDPAELWDGRWRLCGPPGATGRAGALGEVGLAQCPAWRDTGLPRETLLASPAVWDAPGTRLLAAPLAGCPNGWSAELDHPMGDFFTSILSH